MQLQNESHCEQNWIWYCVLWRVQSWWFILLTINVNMCWTLDHVGGVSSACLMKLNKMSRPHTHLDSIWRPECAICASIWNWFIPGWGVWRTMWCLFVERHTLLVGFFCFDYELARCNETWKLITLFIIQISRYTCRRVIKTVDQQTWTWNNMAISIWK